MPNEQRKSGRIWVSPKHVAVIVAIAFLALLIVANAHLLTVAFESQPDCVLPSGQSLDDAGHYRAAKPAC